MSKSLIPACVLVHLCGWALSFAVDPRYHNYAQTATELQRLARQYSNICRLDTIGYSTTYHLPLLALKLSDQPAMREDEPRVLFNGVHHACELIGNEVCLYMANDLLSRYSSDPEVKRWIDSLEIFIMPIVNPDGHSINMSDRDTMWRKNLHDFNGNGRWDPDTDGVDLNRNYDFLWTAGDSNQSSRYYRGQYPFSENETQAIRDLALREKFVADICFHSDIDPLMGEAVYFPWRWGNNFCPDYPEIKIVADSIGRRIVNDRGTGYYITVFGRANEGGMTRNWLYYALGTFSYTIEVSLGYQPPGYRVDSICQRVSKGAYYLLDRALRSGVTGIVTDSTTGLPLVAEVKVREATSTPDTILPRMSDSLLGRYRRLLAPGTYTLEVSKRGYYTKTIVGLTVTAGAPTICDVALVRNPAVQEWQFSRTPAHGLFLSTELAGHLPIGLSFQVAQAGFVRLEVFDQSGRVVRHLVNKQMTPGNYSAVWNRVCDNGREAQAGVYFICLSAGGTGIIRKVVLS